MTLRARRSLLIGVLGLACCISACGSDHGGGAADTVRIETVAGGALGDDGPASSAPLHGTAMVADRSGNLFLADHNRIRRIDADSGEITTLAGNGKLGRCGTGGPAAAACLDGVGAVAIDAAGNVFASENGGRVLRVDARSGRLTHVAGGSDGCVPVTDQPSVRATTACLEGPGALAVDGDGTLFVAVRDGRRILRVDPVRDALTVVAGNGSFEPAEGCADDVPATSTCIGLPQAIALDGRHGLLIASGVGLPLRRVDLDTGSIQRLTGVAGGACIGVPDRGDGRPAREACLVGATGVAVGPDGSVYVLDGAAGQLRRFDAVTSIASTVPLTGLPSGAYQAGLALDHDGVVTIATAFQGTSRIFRQHDGTFELVAGNGTTGSCGDGGSPRAACLDLPSDVAVARDGAVLVAEPSTGRVRRIDEAGETIATLAGNGATASPSGGACADGPDPTAVCLVPRLLAVDGDGDVYVSDETTGYNGRVRRIDATTGAITTVAGGCPGLERDGFVEPRDGTPATDACLTIMSLAVDGEGGLVISTGNRIWRVDRASGRIAAAAGVGDQPPIGFCPDGALATATCILAIDVAVGANGDLLFIDASAASTRLRRIDANGIVTTVAGNGIVGFCGDGGPARVACLDAERVVPTVTGDVLIGGGGIVRRIDAGGIITTIAGDPSQSCTPGDLASAAAGCVAVDAVDHEGRLLFRDLADDYTSRVRRITLPGS